MSSELYSIAVDTANGVVQQPLLIDEIIESSITTLLIGIKVNGNILTITFISAISGGEKTTLDGVVAVHQGPPVNETVEEVVNTDSIQSIGLGGVDIDLLNFNGNILSPAGPTGGIEGMIINADINTVINIDNNEIKASAAIDTTKLANGSVSNTEFQRLDGILSSVVGVSDSQTLTNKTINADNNTITNIDNNEIKAAAAIDTTKLANGTVSNAEFQRLDGILSSVVGISDSQTLSNKTLTSPIISTISNTGTLTLPTSTLTLIGRVPGASIDKGIVTFSGTGGLTIQGAGIRHYGASATNPVSPAPGAGDHYYNTTINHEMAYDASRSKWLSVSSFFDGAGRNGTQGGNSFYRRFNGMVMNVTEGPIIRTGTITGFSFTTASAVTHTAEVLVGGVVITSLSSGGSASASNFSFNNDFSTGIMSVRNAVGSSTTNNFQCTVHYKLRG